jgi:predicted CoA-binding protein
MRNQFLQPDKRISVMPSDYETFWQFERYAVVGHSTRRAFPRLTYGALRKGHKTVYAIDPSVNTIEGDPAYADLSALPGPVDALVIEVPKDETHLWVQKAADAGIKEVWLHMNTDTPEALAIAKDKGLRLRKGTCAVMYLNRGFSRHAIHGFIMRLLGRY